MRNDTQFTWVPETRETRAASYSFGSFWNQWLFQCLKGCCGQDRNAVRLTSSFVTGLGMKNQNTIHLVREGCPSCQLLEKVHCPFPSTELRARAPLTQLTISSGLFSSLTLLWSRGWTRWPSVSSDLNLTVIMLSGERLSWKWGKGAHHHRRLRLTHAVIWQRAWKPNKLPSVTEQSSAWWDWTPKGHYSIVVPARNNCAWMSHSNHCIWVLLLRLSDPVANFITFVLPQNFPLMSAPPFPTFGCCTKFFFYSITPYLRCKPQPQHGLLLTIHQENIWQTCFLYLATSNNLKSLPHAKMRQHSFSEAIIAVFI